MDREAAGTISSSLSRSTRMRGFPVAEEVFFLVLADMCCPLLYPYEYDKRGPHGGRGAPLGYNSCSYIHNGYTATAAIYPLGPLGGKTDAPATA